MTEAISLLDYQRQAASVTRLPVRKLEIPEEGPEWGREATALYRAGWDYKVRLGKRIWRQGHGWWFGEEIAFAMIDKGEQKHV